LPLGYLGVAYNGLNAEMAAEAEFRSGMVTAYINDHPTNWKDREHHLDSLLTRNPALRDQQRNRLFDRDGGELMSAGPKPDWPGLDIVADVYDAGNVVGRLEVELSVRRLLWHTALIGLLGLLLGAAVFFVLRVLPLRALRQATAALAREVEQHAQ